MSQPMRPPDYFHFPTLLALHDAIESLDPAAAPRAALVSSEPDPDPAAARRIAILPGSFNPLHQGHAALAAAALATNAATEVWLGLARVTVDKEQIAGMLLEDRLVALRHFVQDQPRYGVLLFNRGLYVDQALAAHARWPDLDTLLFLVGYDKIVQIFDPRYYDDRDAALRKLFDLASFLVAPRDDATADDLAALLSRPENRPFAARVRILPLPSTVAAVSSTGLRQDLGKGVANPSRSGVVDSRLRGNDEGTADTHPLPPGASQGSGLSGGTVGPGVSLPWAFAGMVAATHAYAPPLPLGAALVDRYTVRAALLTALFQDREWALAHADLRLLLTTALGPTEAGSALRAALLRSTEPAPAPGRLRALIQAVQTGAGK